MAGKCELKGFLNFLVLKLMSNKCISGDDIRTEIGKRKGCKPSPGTIYPVLKSLEQDNLIIECGDGGKIKRYTLTVQGEKEVAEATKKFVILFKELKEDFEKIK